MHNPLSPLEQPVTTYLGEQAPGCPVNYGLNRANREFNRASDWVLKAIRLEDRQRALQRELTAAGTAFPNTTAALRGAVADHEAKILAHWAWPLCPVCAGAGESDGICPCTDATKNIWLTVYDEAGHEESSGTMREFLADNAEDEEFCEAIAAMRAGDLEWFGGGAQPRTKIVAGAKPATEPLPFGEFLSTLRAERRPERRLNSMTRQLSEDLAVLHENLANYCADHHDYRLQLAEQHATQLQATVTGLIEELSALRKGVRRVA